MQEKKRHRFQYKICRRNITIGDDNVVSILGSSKSTEESQDERLSDKLFLLVPQSYPTTNKTLQNYIARNTQFSFIKLLEATLIVKKDIRTNQYKTYPVLFNYLTRGKEEIKRQLLE